MMQNPIHWDEKQTWSARSVTFCVTVEHWTTPLLHPDTGDPIGQRHHWNVYAHLYPNHARYQEFAYVPHGAMQHPALYCVPLHWGCSYFKRNLVLPRQWETQLSGPQEASITIGADYGHAGDERYETCATATSAPDVFRDAEILYRWASGETIAEENLPEPSPIQQLGALLAVLQEP